MNDINAFKPDDLDDEFAAYIDATAFAELLEASSLGSPETVAARRFGAELLAADQHALPELDDSAHSLLDDPDRSRPATLSLVRHVVDHFNNSGRQDLASLWVLATLAGRHDRSDPIQTTVPAPRPSDDTDPRDAVDGSRQNGSDVDESGRSTSRTRPGGPRVHTLAKLGAAVAGAVLVAMIAATFPADLWPFAAGSRDRTTTLAAASDPRPHPLVTPLYLDDLAPGGAQLAMPEGELGIFVVPIRGTAVHSPAAGVVVSVERAPNPDQVILAIRSFNGDMAIYSGISDPTVAVGDDVVAGQFIAVIDPRVPEPALHFQVVNAAGNDIDEISWLHLQDIGYCPSPCRSQPASADTGPTG
jgi:hypothetical protein